MKVKDLIEELKDLDPELIVAFPDYEHGDLESIRSVKIRLGLFSGEYSNAGLLAEDDKFNRMRYAHHTTLLLSGNVVILDCYEDEDV